MKSRKKFLTTLISWLVILSVAALFLKSIISNWHGIKDLGLTPDGFVIASLFCFVLSIIASGIGWGHIVERLTNTTVTRKEAVRVHLASWLLKYIPGQAGSLLNKLAWAKNKGLDGKKITASFIYENIFLLIASTVTSVPILLIMLSSRFAEGLNLFVPLLVIIPGIIFIMTPSFFAFILNILFKLLKKKRLEKGELLTAKDNTRFIGEFIIPRIINGAAFTLLAISLLGISPEHYVVYAAIYILAGIVGLLAIFVPSGLGVREAVITLFATAYLPIEQAIALSLLARFYATVADVFVAFLYLLLKPKKVAV